jgi:carboxymethylenebutenolidase
MKRFLALLPLVLVLGCFRAQPAPPPPALLEEKVGYSSGKDQIQGELFHTEDTTPQPALILVHDDFGATDWVREQARNLAESYVVLVVDLYRGDKPGNLMDAHILGRGLPDERALGDLKAAMDYLSSRPDVKANAIGIIGFGLGGGYALDAAIADPRIKAVVTCYGRVPTEPKTLSTLQAPVLGIFAAGDAGITPDTLKRFETAMTKAGKRLDGLHVFQNCGHGFLDPNAPTPSGTEKDRDDAWEMIETFLEKELQP